MNGIETRTMFTPITIIPHNTISAAATAATTTTATTSHGSNLWSGFENALCLTCLASAQHCTCASPPLLASSSPSSFSSGMKDYRLIGNNESASVLYDRGSGLNRRENLHNTDYHTSSMNGERTLRTRTMDEFSTVPANREDGEDVCATCNFALPYCACCVTALSHSHPVTDAFFTQDHNRSNHHSISGPVIPNVLNLDNTSPRRSATYYTYSAPNNASNTTAAATVTTYPVDDFCGRISTPSYSSSNRQVRENNGSLPPTSHYSRIENAPLSGEEQMFVAEYEPGNWSPDQYLNPHILDYDNRSRNTEVQNVRRAFVHGKSTVENEGAVSEKDGYLHTNCTNEDTAKKREEGYHEGDGREEDASNNRKKRKRSEGDSNVASSSRSSTKNAASTSTKPGRHRRTTNASRDSDGRDEVDEERVDADSAKDNTSEENSSENSGVREVRGKSNSTPSSKKKSRKSSGGGGGSGGTGNKRGRKAANSSRVSAPATMDNPCKAFKALQHGDGADEVVSEAYIAIKRRITSIPGYVITEEDVEEIAHFTLEQKIEIMYKCRCTNSKFTDKNVKKGGKRGKHHCSTCHLIKKDCTIIFQKVGKRCPTCPGEERCGHSKYDHGGIHEMAGINPEKTPRRIILTGLYDAAKKKCKDVVMEDIPLFLKNAPDLRPEQLTLILQGKLDKAINDETVSMICQICASPIWNDLCPLAMECGHYICGICKETPVTSFRCLVCCVSCDPKKFEEIEFR